MRRTFAGPMSSQYKEKDFKQTKIIENLDIGTTSYIEKMEKDIQKNPVGKTSDPSHIANPNN